MKPIYLHLGGALALTFSVAACIPPAPDSAPKPTPAATAAPRPAPAPTPSQAATYSSWMDVPKSPGDWSYGAGAAGGIAQFGEGASEPRITLRCMPAARQVVLIRHGSGANPPTALTIRTEGATRTLTATAASDRASVSVALAANDPLLDAMALTKGRFAVEAQGLPTLYVPAWAEVTRVIEDCR